MNTETKPDEQHREVLSPEGVEERVMLEAVVRVTLTGGGRYRIYAGDTEHLTTLGVVESEEVAARRAALAMVTWGMFRIDPKAVIESLIDDLKGRE